MTKEEAIKILKELPNNILGVVLPFDIDFDYTQALDMAIKSLEQETVSKEVYDSEYFARKQAEYELWKIKEQAPCEDTVSRSEVVEWLRRASKESIQHAIDSNLEFISSVTPKLPECKDTISRVEVDRLCYRYLKAATDEHVAFYEHFLDLPSVTPERKVGHWITDSSSGMCYCSKCGFGKSQLANGWCAACGAEMRDVENETQRD